MCQAGRKARKSARRPADKQSVVREGSKKEFFKFNERCRNVFENKGPLRKTYEQSGNVYENKGI
jgi:hypothetical protein